jgi:hypothetical protein
LGFLKDTHKNLESELKALLEDYDQLGAKISRFISFVEKGWKPPRSND